MKEIFSNSDEVMLTCNRKNDIESVKEMLNLDHYSHQKMLSKLLELVTDKFNTGIRQTLSSQTVLVGSIDTTHFRICF